MTRDQSSTARHDPSTAIFLWAQPAPDSFLCTARDTPMLAAARRPRASPPAVREPEVDCAPAWLGAPSGSPSTGGATPELLLRPVSVSSLRPPPCRRRHRFRTHRLDQFSKLLSQPRRNLQRLLQHCRPVDISLRLLDPIPQLRQLLPTRPTSAEFCAPRSRHRVLPEGLPRLPLPRNWSVRPSLHPRPVSPSARS